jgi:tryptophan synthase alpha chain
MKDNIANAFNQGHKGLVIYVTAGHPNMEESERLIGEFIEAGADLIELGVPFSDPMADGAVIQESSQIALSNGATLPKIIDMAARLRKKYATPMILFSYYNILLAKGFEQTVASCAEAGIDGLLIVDLPQEEIAEVKPALDKYNLALVRLIAPTTPPERAREIVAGADGFIYYITVRGVTGVRSAVAQDLEEHLSTLRKLSPVPVAAGFGISTPEQARASAQYADGAVVGSAVVRLVSQGKQREAVELVRSLAAGLA